MIVNEFLPIDSINNYYYYYDDLHYYDHNQLLNIVDSAQRVAKDKRESAGGKLCIYLLSVDDH